MVLPTSVAPASRSRVMTVAVRVAGAWLTSQSGLPQQQTWPSTSKMSFAAKLSPASSPPGRPGIRMSTCWQKALKELRSGAGGVVIALGCFRHRCFVGIDAAENDVTVRQHFGCRVLRHGLHEHLQGLKQLADALDRFLLRILQRGVLRER